MIITRRNTLKSPCVKVCKLSECKGFCLGCLRTPEEISNWRLYTNEERDYIINLLEVRKKFYTFRKD